VILSKTTVKMVHLQFDGTDIVIVAISPVLAGEAVYIRLALAPEIAGKFPAVKPAAACCLLKVAILVPVILILPVNSVIGVFADLIVQVVDDPGLTGPRQFKLIVFASTLIGINKISKKIRYFNFFI